MKSSTRKITISAVCTAFAVIMCAMTAYLPLSFMPLFLAAFCIFTACKRGGLVYGCLCAAATVLLMFFMSGLSVKWLTLVIVFAPYGILCYFIYPFGYFKPVSAVIRIAAVVVFYNATLASVAAIVLHFPEVGSEGLNIAEWVSKLGGYAVLAVAFTAIMLSLDFMFTVLSATVLKKIPDPERKGTKQDSGKNDGQTDEKYDIFGYEINRSDSETSD